jgi:hypothetical protein
MKALNFRRFAKNTLVGFFDLQLASGLIIRDCTLHLSHGRHWVGLPGKPYKDAAGKETWANIVDFDQRATRDAFQRQAAAAALAALREAAAA